MGDAASVPVFAGAAAGVLVILINAAYQDGDVAHAPQRVLRYAASGACFLLVPLVLLAAYALNLRVSQYGWTAERVATQACIIVAACYAAGYAIAALIPKGRLRRIERWNFVSAVLILVVLAALYSPLADPDRIAVASQVAQLQGGSALPYKFDFEYLRWRSGRYGVEALEQLVATATGKHAKEIRTKAQELLARKTSFQSPPEARGADIAANVSVYPKGMKLPPDFLHQDWNRKGDTRTYPACLKRRGATCDAFLLEMSNDGQTEIVILRDSEQDLIFAKSPDGVWRPVARPGPLWSCGTVVEALHAGQAAIQPPAIPRWRDITVKGAALSILPTFDQESSCPK